MASAVPRMPVVQHCRRGAVLIAGIIKARMGRIAAAGVADRTAAVLGKLLIASLFWWSGVFGSLMTWPDVVGYVASKQIPLPWLAAAGATALEILVPIALFVGALEAWAAVILAGYCLLTAALFHDFWMLSGDDRAIQMIQFFKNMALAGALLVMASCRTGGRRQAAPR